MAMHDEYDERPFGEEQPIIDAAEGGPAPTKDDYLAALDAIDNDDDYYAALDAQEGR